MTKFMLILRSDVTADYSSYTPEDFGTILAEYQAWGEEMERQKRLILGRKLTDQGGLVLKPQPGGKVVTQDGPYVETKEVVGGVYVIEADSYEHAAKLCAKHPNFRFGSIEIRELDFMGQPES